MNPRRGERHPLERLTASSAAENVARASTVASLLLLGERATPLSRSLSALSRTLADAREMDERSRVTFAAIGNRTFANRFGPELLLAEGERALEEAA